MCANSQSNWLNTIAVRTSYILPILKRFPWWKPRKTGGWSISPRKKPKQKPVCLFEFWGRPFKLAKFIEIGKMACSTTARCTRGQALNSCIYHQQRNKKLTIVVWQLCIGRAYLNCFQIQTLIFRVITTLSDRIYCSTIIVATTNTM